MQQWEYLTRTMSGTLLGADWLRARLGELGDQGWELVTALPIGSGGGCDHHSYVFKRPKVTDAQASAAPSAESPRPIHHPDRAA